MLTGFLLLHYTYVIWPQINSLYNPAPLWMGVIQGVFGFAFLLIGLLPQPHRLTRFAILLGALILLSGYYYREKANNYLYNAETNDIKAYNEYAARLLIAGQNPYSSHMSHVFPDFNIGTWLITPTLDKEIVDVYAYPPLAFLFHAAFALLQWDLLWVVPAFFGAVVVLFYFALPSPLRPLTVLALFLTEVPVAYSSAGINDMVWVFFVLLALARFKRPLESGLWFGLACAAKQQPWFLAPFLVVRLLDDQPLQLTLRHKIIPFIAAAVGAFLVVNLPFMIWDFGAWFAGLTMVFRTNLLISGAGFSTLMDYGLLNVSRSGLSLTALVIYLTVWLYYVRFHRQVPLLMYLAPLLFFWLGYRSYWHYQISFWVLLFFEALRQPEQFSSQAPPLYRVALAALDPTGGSRPERVLEHCHRGYTLFAAKPDFATGH
jgi:uncharacterized membrane protein